MKDQGTFELYTDPAGRQYPVQLYDGTPPHEAADTSTQAAHAIRETSGTLREQVYRAICSVAFRGLTDEEGIERTGMAANTWRPRRRELELLGKIHYEGTRKTRSGRNAKVWYAV